MTKWEVSIIELKLNGKTKYKITKRIPEMSVADTRVFDSKEDAIRQLEEWLG